MKNMKWFGALLFAGSMLAGGVVAQAGPGMGPYGPWNSGGAFGGFGPYATSSWVGGCKMPNRVLSTLAIQPEIVGERIVTMPGHKKHHHKKIIFGERKVYQELRRPLFANRCTPTRLKLLGVQRFSPPQTVIETRRAAVFAPARQEVVAERLVPAQTEIIAPATSCDLVNPYL